MIIALALAAILLYFSLRDVDFNAVLAAFGQARVEYLVVAALALAASYFMRALRWRTLLSADRPIAPLTAYWGVWVGYLGNSLLPARAGELLRSVMIGRKTGINVGFALATTLTERIIDAGILVLMALIAISTLETAPETLIAGARVGAVIAFVGIAFVLIAPRLERQLRAILAWILGKLPIPAGIGVKLDAFLARFLTGMRALINVRRAALFALFAAAAWSIDVAVAAFVGRAFDMPLTVTQILLLLASLGLASAAPSTPGYLGIYQAVARAVLVPLGYSENLAIAFIFAFQFVSYLTVIGFGVIGIWRLNVGGARIADLLKTENTR
jgi:uncharacterized protein (TIRG00374 family)